MATFAISFALPFATMGVLGEAQAAPQTFNTALPVGKGDFILREQFLNRKASDDPSPMERSLEVLGGVSVLGYGVSSDWAIFGMLSYLDKELDLTMPGGQRITRSTSGPGRRSELDALGAYDLILQLCEKH